MRVSAQHAQQHPAEDQRVEIQSHALNFRETMEAYRYAGNLSHDLRQSRWRGVNREVRDAGYPAA